MSDNHKPTGSHDPLAVLAGGGEMGARTRAFDWATTPLGPVGAWPHSLLSIVRVMLSSRYAMWLGWGPDLTFFYNDAYARMTLGPKHPWALGRPAREVWSEIWADIGPRAESVLRTGAATWDEGLLLFLERRGFPEETYHTFSYSPVPDDAGGVGGMLCVVTEDTERTIGERRLRTLRELAARTTDEARAAEDACQTAALLLGGNLQDVPFALLYLLDAAGNTATLAGTTNLARGTPLSPVVVGLDDGAAPWPFRQVAETGAAVVVGDLVEKFGPLPGGAWPEPAHQAVVLPMAKPGQTRLAGFVVAGVSPRRPFDDAYRGFLDLLAGQIATAVANARAYEEERRRAEALAALDRAKTAFFSNVSHEFRTPLTLMLGPVEELLARSHTDLTPAAAEQLQVVSRNGLRLLRLVNTLLDFSRIEAGRVRAVFQPTDLAALTADLASQFRAAVERAGLRLVVDCRALPEAVYVDREMWEKVVLNLLSNAFKFTHEGEIFVGLQSAECGVRSEEGEDGTEKDALPGLHSALRTPHSAILIVRDTGTGIPAEEMPRLFERFHRVQNARGRTHEGSGIGLALVQELVKLHGGTVNAESVVGQGTTFCVTVPLGRAHLPPDQVGTARGVAVTSAGATLFVEEALRWLPDEEDKVAKRQGDTVSADELGSIGTAAVPLSAEEADDRPCVLVADDNADMRQYVVRLLAEQFRVVAVPDGAAALATARERPPDLVLTDVMMPRLDGFGLLRELRADPRTSALPVIMLSARAGEESRVEGMEFGADDYLVKPFSARELLARVSAHLQMARLRKEANETLRHSEERLRLALNAARMVAWEYDPAADRVTASDNLADVYGLPPGTTIQSGAEGFPLIHPDDRERHQGTVMKAIAGQGSYLSQFRICRPDNGAVMWLEERGHAVSGPAGTMRLVGVVMDITDRKRAEEELRQVAAALSEADRRKDEFLATLAHELRNPLAPLRNGLEVMKLAQADSEAVEQARAMMERQLGQMVHLIDDLMDLSRVSRGKVQLRKERVELAKVVQQAVETSRPLIEERGHAFTLNVPKEPLYVDADATRLAQVFANLLNNAAKYTDRGGRIRLSVARRDGQAVVSVQDNGVGIPAPMLPKVFDIFTQVDRSLEKAQGGLGIGLSLVKRLVEMHGGGVEARSAGHGLGSEFIVTLPLAPAPARQGGADKGVSGSRARRRILVADDNVDAAASLGMLLRLMGNEVRTAHDGAAAVEAAEAFRPDVALLDIGMPKLNGLEACRRIRAQPWGGQMVLVALTGWGQEDDRRQTREAGFDHHVVKPVDPAKLEQLLATLKPTPA